MSDHSKPVTEDVVPPELRQSYKDNSIVPLWESVPATSFGKQIEEAQIWRWSTMLPIIQETAKMRATHVLDRRVLLMTNPKRLHVWDEAGTGPLMFDFQCVMPGERAGAHRHPMNALRFVVQCTGGVKSIVDGKDCVMEPGDLILTPGWCWHEHVNEGKDPIIWLDVLDVMLHHFLGTTASSLALHAMCDPSWRTRHSRQQASCLSSMAATMQAVAIHPSSAIRGRCGACARCLTCGIRWFPGGALRQPANWRSLHGPDRQHLASVGIREIDAQVQELRSGNVLRRRRPWGQPNR